MTTLNLLWPRWAELAAHLHWKVAEARGWRALWLIRKAGALLANRYGRERDAAAHRLVWERVGPAKRELLAGLPRFTPSSVRRFVVMLAIPVVVLGASSAARADEAKPEDGGRLYDALGYAMFGGSAGDLLSTEYALSQGGSELNPLLQNRGVRIGSAVAFPVAANYLTDELRKNGHPKIALWMRVALVGLKGYAVYHNLRAAP